MRARRVVDVQRRVAVDEQIARVHAGDDATDDLRHPGHLGVALTVPEVVATRRAVPAIVVLGFWILIQLVSGMGSIAATSNTGGVAYMAHVGGFVAGVLLVKLMTAGRPAMI